MLLASAARIFARDGYEGASIAQIAAEAGITSGAIYRHFKSKGDLLLALIEDHGNVVDTDRFATIGTSDLGEISRLISSYLDEDAQLIRRLAVEIHTAAFRDPQAGELLTEFVRAARSKLANKLEAGKSSGIVPASLDSQMIADVIFVLIMGLCHMDTIDPTLIGDTNMKYFIENRVMRMLTNDYDDEGDA